MSNDKAPPRSIFGIGVRVRVRPHVSTFGGMEGKTVPPPDYWTEKLGYQNAVLLDNAPPPRRGIRGFDNDELEAI